MIGSENITGRRDAEGGKVEIGGKALTRKEEKAHTAGTRQTRHAAATERDRETERQRSRSKYYHSKMPRALIKHCTSYVSR